MHSIAHLNLGAHLVRTWTQTVCQFNMLTVDATCAEEEEDKEKTDKRVMMREQPRIKSPHKSNKKWSVCTNSEIAISTKQH